MMPLLTSSESGAPVGVTTLEAQTGALGKVAQPMAKASASVRMRVERRFMSITGVWEGFGIATAHQLVLVGLREIERLRIGAAAHQLDLVCVGAAGAVRLEAEIGRLIVPGDGRIFRLAPGIGGHRLL